MKKLPLRVLSGSSLVGLLSCNTELLRPLLEHLRQNTFEGDPTHNSEEREPASTLRSLTPSEVSYFVAEYTAGKSTRQIAEATGRSRTAISAALKRAGVTMRAFRSSTQQDIDEMAELRAAGMSLVGIAERLGYSEKTVWTQLKKAAGKQVTG